MGMNDDSEVTPEALAGTRLLVGGSRLVSIPPNIAAAFAEGDRLLALPDGAVLHIPRAVVELVDRAVGLAQQAFYELAQAPQENVTRFYATFAARLQDDQVWAGIEKANAADVDAALKSGRSTTRLVLSAKMREGMIAGLQEWQGLPSPVGRIAEVTEHPGWKVEHVVSPLGIVAFVFEGRPNVFADATGVLRSGNTAVLRIGRDALRTAEAIVEGALQPALRLSGLPEGAIVLLQSREHAAGWALFSDARVSLAVARGSGPAVRQLGAVARQAGIPASLHGTGGAWMAADRTANPDRFRQAVFHSLDRKVCNTLNTLCLVKSGAESLVPILMQALDERHQKDGKGYRLHLTLEACSFFNRSLFEELIAVHRSDGLHTEPIATKISEEELGREWEWEQTPEISVTVVDDLAEAATLFNRYSPQFVTSLISEDPEAHDFFFKATNAPFVGDGFTRWVDGQFALQRPELGLSNWQNGRLLGRSGVLSGDSIFAIRLRVRQEDAGVCR